MVQGSVREVGLPLLVKLCLLVCVLVCLYVCLYASLHTRARGCVCARERLCVCA